MPCVLGRKRCLPICALNELEMSVPRFCIIVTYTWGVQVEPHVLDGSTSPVCTWMLVIAPANIRITHAAGTMSLLQSRRCCCLKTLRGAHAGVDAINAQSRLSLRSREP